ncbi:MAG: leucine-rich repeat domain-containing protein [Clostridiales bacterium]|jgi:hypothetical protein|nr:leucine-rich repeat domain-containing protein [Clostridiales bacterium]
MSGETFLIKDGELRKYTGGDENVAIPHGVTRIATKAFSGCKTLVGAIIPDSVESIGNYAFSGCRELASVEIPESVTTIGSWAFSHCGKLASVSIPGKVAKIPCQAFGGCRELAAVELPEGLEFIGEAAFSGCAKLTNVVLPGSVTSIDRHAFYGCLGLRSAVFAGIPASIGLHAFEGCENVAIIAPESVAAQSLHRYKETKALLAFFSSGKSLHCFGTQDSKELLSRSRNFLGLIISSDDLEKMKGYFRIIGITPESFDEVHELARIGRATKILGFLEDLKAGGLLAEEELEAFRLAVRAKEEAWEARANEGRARGFIVTDDGILKKYAGAETHVDMPEGVQRIGKDAFKANKDLISVTVPEGVKSIEDRAFSSCESLESVTLPDSLETIANGAFSFCKSLRHIVIPKNVKKLENSVFAGCHRPFTAHCLGETDYVALESEPRTPTFDKRSTVIKTAETAPFDYFAYQVVNYTSIVLLAKYDAHFDSEQMFLKQNVSKNLKKILPALCADDKVENIKRLSRYAEISAKNFDVFFEAAQEANATQITAFLMDYRRKSISDEEVEKQEELKLEKEIAKAAKKAQKASAVFAEHGELTTKGMETISQYAERHIVRVKFADGVSYKYICDYVVEAGNRVLVGGARMGQVGVITEVEEGLSGRYDRLMQYVRQAYRFRALKKKRGTP